jgi:hypothetical protein
MALGIDGTQFISGIIWVEGVTMITLSSSDQIETGRLWLRMLLVDDSHEIAEAVFYCGAKE